MGLRMDHLHAPTVASGPTSRTTANGTDKKSSLQELITQKEKLEAELSALGSVLDSHGVNMNTSLLTFDGFPRADIDVAQIRTTRASIIRLKNDYKTVMAKLESAVQDAFASGKASEAADADAASAAVAAAARLPARPTTTTTAAAAEGSTAERSPPTFEIEPPFAKVNTIVSGSPADHAGLKVGDQVTRFGSVDWTNHERLGRVVRVVQQNENVS